MSQTTSQQAELEVLGEKYKAYIAKLKADWLSRKRKNSKNVLEVMSERERGEVDRLIDQWGRYIVPFAEAWWKERGYCVIWPEDNSKPMRVRRLTVREELQDFPMEVLVRLWFRILWQKFSAGGINAGRSMRCEMLDCYLDFVPVPKLPRDTEEYVVDGLEEEIMSRPVCRSRRRFMSLEEIKSCTKEELPLLGLGALQALEWSVHSDIAWKGGYELERKNIREVLRRFPCICISRSCSLSDACYALCARRVDLKHEELNNLNQTFFDES